MGERSGLPQHGVDERGLTVVDVSDDGDITKIWAYIHFKIVAAWAHNRENDGKAS
ncbi:MAG: hypothetical protein JWR11_496 [Mycobacterium sp.]|nr:hypothetical protein [Mycobacterium sp.]MDT5177277.1 hypothetical protein [Mycobacterium sp.]